MPWRPDFIQSYWVDPDWTGLAGDPSQAQPVRLEDLGPRQVESHDRVHTDDGAPERPLGAAVMVVRDRTGFEYRRDVGLDDCVSVREAAQLLQLPIMTIHRWVKNKTFKSTKRNRFTVIRLREVARVARDKQRPLRLGSRLVILR